jgi:GNAT superfamily N-acetyltransferase
MRSSKPSVACLQLFVGRESLSVVGIETDAEISVRAIVPNDAPAYRSILQRTSAQDRYCRFFHVVDHLDDDAIERYVEVRADTIGLIAERHGRALGVAHAFFIDKRRAEIAMIVASDGRRQGVGRLLFERLIAALQRRGCMCVVAYSLAQNGPLSKLARTVGMRPGTSDGGIVTWTLSPIAYTPAGSTCKNPERTTGFSLLVSRGLLILIRAAFTTTLTAWGPAVLAAAFSLGRLDALQRRV